MAKEAWIISVNMGYGHQRTAFPLKYLAFNGEIINANDYLGIPEKDRKIWETTRIFYEFISNFKRISLIGEFVFFVFDRFQKILSFYPKRDLSESNFQLKQIFSMIENGWGKDLIETLRRGSGQEGCPPLVSTFFTPAFMAEHFKYPGDIFCIVCDTDIARAWASLNPKLSRIKYFVPTERVAERLQLYGIKPRNIFFTGYPLPMENIGGKNMEILKEDLGHRLLNLDPKQRYNYYYELLIKKYLGKLPSSSNHPLTLMFSVGGAGAQKEIGVKILKCLKRKIKLREIKIIFSVGVKEKTRRYFEKNIQGLGLKNAENIEILFEKDFEKYFQKFNQALRTTDILWTKPSELSFYSALGLPIIIAPTIGSQEEFNKRWLVKSGFGLLQEDPSHVEQWLFDWLEQGYLAEAAMQGFIEGEKLGTLNIKRVIEKCSG
ncbi:MAG: hypothetical protein Q7S82_02835 [bacterium]|nr:hypothetical protein [bacterium]